MRKFIVPIIIVVLVSLTIYRYLGGTASVTLEISEGATFQVQAEYFQGAYNATELENIFNTSKSLAEAYNVPIAVINKGSDQFAEQVQQWVGVVTPSQPLPDSLVRFQTLKFTSDKTLRGILNSHNSVMPKPEKIRELAQWKADSLGLTLQDQSLELYYPDGEIEVVFLLKN